MTADVSKRVMLGQLLGEENRGAGVPKTDWWALDGNLAFFICNQRLDTLARRRMHGVAWLREGA